MRAKPDKYREYLYENEEHPEDDVFELHDRRDSFTTIYLSLIPFLFVEYIFQRGFPLYPAGLLFPFGFLLFWSFYYTFYRPNDLETRLKNKSNFSLLELPELLLGCILWFLKETLSEMLDVLIFSWLPKSQPKAQRNLSRVQFRRMPPELPSNYKPIPKDIQQALQVMGLAGCRNWDTIHDRYRELAKRYHPDLNPDITEVGRRFMNIDNAYKRLSTVKDEYFNPHRKSA